MRIRIRLPEMMRIRIRNTARNYPGRMGRIITLFTPLSMYSAISSPDGLGSYLLCSCQLSIIYLNGKPHGGGGGRGAFLSEYIKDCLQHIAKQYYICECMFWSYVQYLHPLKVLSIEMDLAERVAFGRSSCSRKSEMRKF
jgi:hypothetical protein